MMILIRYVLVGLVIYLVIRSFLRFWQLDEPTERKSKPDKESDVTIKRVSKETGEYVDYEEVDE